MKRWTLLFALMFLVLGLSSQSQGALFDRGNGLIYDDVLNVTWTQDANLFATIAAASPGVVSQIVAVTPTVDTHTMTEGDFVTSNGRMDWWGARAFINYLNAIEYGGSAGWRLPHVSPTHEFSELFNTEFGGSVTTYTNDANFNLFSNIQTASYATDAYSGRSQTVFNTSQLRTYGSGINTSNRYSVWAVADGDVGVAAVPIPAAVFLFGGGLGALGFIKRKALALRQSR